MYMSVGRNDPCPCGSGKKYKHCCLNKKNIIQLDEFRQEKFYQEKHALVKKIRTFISEQIPFQKYHQLRSQFNERTNNCISPEEEESFFVFWLFFFHRFENNLRGIEWFYEINGRRLAKDEVVMAKRWLGLKPRLLQAIAPDNTSILFEDVYTKEKFSVSMRKENLPSTIPWMSTFAFIEPFSETYYFNGVQSFSGPEDLNRTKQKVMGLMKKTGQSFDEIVMEFYPEILATFEEGYIDMEKGGKKTISEHTLTYQINNEPVVLEFLRSIPSFEIVQWDKTEKRIDWMGDWRAYRDTEMEGEIKLTELFGTISIRGEKLEFKSMSKSHVDEVKNVFAELSNALLFENEEEFVLGAFPAEVKSTVVSLQEGIPQYFGVYAQSDMNEMLDTPIPMYGDLSLNKLVEKGKQEIADTWLRQSEYMLFRQVLQQEGKVEVTPDFNTIRKQLGLPLSPFVTGGNSRKTSIVRLEPEKKKRKIFEEDVPFLESLGFHPQTIDNFYWADILRFFKERTIGKSDATIKKYRNSLFDLREMLEQKAVSSWQQCDLTFWDTLITNDYSKLEWRPTLTERRNFLSTLAMFLKWLDQKNKTAYFAETVKFIQSIRKG